MNPALRSLLSEAESADGEIASGALMRIALLLERTRRIGPAAMQGNWSLYRDVLPTPLQNIDLTESDHDVVVRTLCSRAVPEHLLPTVMWAIGKARTIPAVRGLFEVMDAGAVTSEHAWYQFCVALHDSLAFVEPQNVATLRDLLNLHDASRQVRIKSFADDPDLAEAARRALQAIERVRG